MEPLNQAERSAAIRRFAGVYCLSLLPVLLAAYFFFQTPTEAIRKENESLKTTLAEQTKLIGRLDVMSGRLSAIETADKTYMSSMNAIEKGTLRKNLEEYENTIKNALYELKRDSTNLADALGKRTASGIAGSFDALLTYRNTIGYLRDLLEKNGVSTEAIDKLRADLVAKSEKVEMLELMLKQRPAPAPSGGGGGGGGGGGPDPELGVLRGQVKNLQDENARLKTASVDRPVVISGKGGDAANELEDRLAFVTADCLVKQADEDRKRKQERLQLYNQALDALKKLQESAHLDNYRVMAKQKIDYVNDKLPRVKSKDF
ncbi:MAG: hypothetical protein H7Y12_07180 [Sphingobacteriaceae bacterium]|nr:hypothetical protein [Cytophagaceae bacterium]